MNLIFNIEATNRTNSITPRNLVIPACFNVKFMVTVMVMDYGYGYVRFMVTYSKLHKGFSVRIFSCNI